MLDLSSQEYVMQNLKDAGCDHKIIEDYFRYDGENQVEQLKILEKHRETLLRRVHKEEKRISCLDYLIYQIKSRNICEPIAEKERKV